MDNNAITAGTIARTIVLFVAIINQILASKGMSPLPFADEDITQAVSVIFTMVAALVSWWKNSSFTKAARQADVLMNAIKSGQADEETVTAILSAIKK